MTTLSTSTLFNAMLALVASAVMLALRIPTMPPTHSDLIAPTVPI